MIKLTKKSWLTISILLVILAALYVCAYFLSRYYLSNENIQDLVTMEIENNIQRKVSMSSATKFSITWDLAPHVTIADLKIANASWSQQATMLTAATVDLKFSLIQLLFKKFHISSLRIDNLNLLLETNGEQNNWTFGASTDTNDFTLLADSIVITQAKVTFLEAGATPIVRKIESLHCDIDLQSNGFELQIEKFKAGSSDINGRLKVNYADPIVINGTLKTNNFAPRDFIDSSDNSGSYSLPKTAFPQDLLKTAKIDITFDIGTLTLDKLKIQDFSIYIYTKDQSLIFDQDQPAKIANGTLDLDMSYNLAPKIPTFSLSIVSSQIDFNTLLSSMFNKSPLSGSQFKFTSNIQSSGDSVYSLVRNSNGKILATISAGQFVNSNASLSNLFTNILSALITFNKQASTTEFKCGVVNLNVNNGIASANNGIGMETSTVNVLGSGSIDLTTGAINFNITPSNLSKNPLDIAQYSIARSVSIGGTVADPQVNLNPIGMLGSTAAVAAISGALTGGVATAIAGASTLLNSGSTGSTIIDPCKTAMGN